MSEFYVTDRALKRAQARVEAALAGDRGQDEGEAYVRAVRAYFTQFQSEARAHLRNLDRRLEQINQIRFNLTAERSVAVRRLEETAEVLGRLETDASADPG